MRLFVVLSLMVITGCKQSVPADKLYMGQPPPGSTPKVFPLSVKEGFFAAERIVISNDGRDIYYSRLRAIIQIPAKVSKNTAIRTVNG